MKLSIALFALCGSAATALAQVTYTTGTYTQDFNTLANSGSTAPWANNSTLLGWFSFGSSAGSNTIREPTSNSVIVQRIDTGSGNSGGLMSYGSAASTDRALGSLGSASFESVILLVVQNNNTFDLTSFTLAFTGEQWRNGAPSPNAAQSLVFDYTVLSSLPTATEATANYLTGYTAVPALNFTSPIATGTTAAALDGNAAANRTAISQTVTATIPAGSYLVMRWWDNNDPSNDHGLALDDVSFSAIPTPGAAALLGMGLLASTRRRRA